MVGRKEAVMNQRTTQPVVTEIPQTGDASALGTEFMTPTGAAPDHKMPIRGLDSRSLVDDFSKRRSDCLLDQ